MTLYLPNDSGWSLFDVFRFLLDIIKTQFKSQTGAKFITMSAAVLLGKDLFRACTTFFYDKLLSMMPDHSDVDHTSIAVGIIEDQRKDTIERVRSLLDLVDVENIPGSFLPEMRPLAVEIFLKTVCFFLRQPFSAHHGLTLEEALSKCRIWCLKTTVAAAVLPGTIKITSGVYEGTSGLMYQPV